MTARTDQHFAVLDAAEALLAARADQMITADEWQALQAAVVQATRPEPPDPGESDETFAIDGAELVRSVVPARGTPYAHRCTRAVYEHVAHAVDDLGGDGFTQESLVTRLRVGQQVHVPWTQVAVALAFMKERGCVVPVHGRKHRGASKDVYLDAMTEWHALREGAAGA